MTSVSGISAGTRQASILAATKAASATVRHVEAVQDERDRLSTIVTAAPAIDDTRENLSVTDTYEADDTFAHTEGQKLRGGRLDLIV